MTMIRRLAIAGLLIAVAGAAQAAGVTVDNSGTTVAAAAKTANGGYRSVVISNQSATATISCTDDGSTPAINGAGSYDIPPGGARHWGDATVVYTGPFKCISSAASSPASVTAQ